MCERETRIVVLMLFCNECLLDIRLPTSEELIEQNVGILNKLRAEHFGKTDHKAMIINQKTMKIY